MFQRRFKSKHSLKKLKKYSTQLFNNIPVEHSTIQKHLGVYDETLNFNTHSTEKVGKAANGIVIIKKLFKRCLTNHL